MIHLLRIYVTILCNWLILWQNTLYLYLGRSRICLILQETLFQVQMLKPCKSAKNQVRKCWILKLDSCLTPFQHLAICRASKLFLIAISTPSQHLVDRSSKFLSPWHLLDSCICRSLKLDTFSTLAICRGLRKKQNFWFVFLESVNVSLGFFFS